MLALVVTLGCAASSRPADPPELDRAAFRFPEDSFGFANETVWDYGTDPETGAIRPHPAETPRSFTFRCTAMARAARQFLRGARFEPTLPPVDDATYASLVRRVLDTDPRRQPAERVTIPGFRNLRELSEAHESLLMDALDGVGALPFQRGNWRMIFPFTPDHQKLLALRLRDEIARKEAPIVHLVIFPERTINHLVLLFAVDESPAEIRFRAYDPNVSTTPLTLVYDRAERTFRYARSDTFAGGPVKAYEVYAGWMY